tara:strand:+ start:4698 stop:5387 length:690 start_codon:yes stop_codon:yes gene_type:complete
MPHRQLKFLCLSLTVVTLLSIGLVQSTLGRNDNPNGIRDLLVGTCIEEAKDTSVDYQCLDPERTCVAQQLTKTYTLGLEVGTESTLLKIFTAAISTSVSYSVNVDNGCGNPAGTNKTECVREAGVTFTEFPGDMVGLHKADCSDFTEDDCQNIPNGTQEIPAPNSVVDAINIALAGAGDSRVVPYGATFKVPVTKCGTDQIGVTSGTCPGTNGGQTWYKVSGELCNAGP